MKFIVAILIIILIAVVVYAPFWLRAKRRAEAREFDKAARWEMYSEPIGADFKSYEIGARIELSSGTYSFPMSRWDGVHPVLDNRLEAESAAIAKAVEFDTVGWRPDAHV
jgi:hypothetical protein